jgi:FMN phosphatase YigB (HAD superfamily)
MKTHVIFDLDHTILDTRSFDRALGETLRPFGLSYEQYKEAYKATVTRIPGEYDFSIHAFLDVAIARHPELAEHRSEIGLALDRTLGDVGMHLFPGSGALLESIRPHVDTLTLLTKGNRAWQEAKVNSSGIAPMFDRHVYVADNKVDMLEHLIIDGERTAFVNDNPEENMGIRTRYPGLTLIHVEGPLGTPNVLSDRRTVGIEGISLALSDFLDTPL